MTLIVSSFSVDELERYALCAPPEMAEVAKRELEARGPGTAAGAAALAELDDEIELAEDALRMAEREVEDAEDELVELRRRRKALEGSPCK